MEPNVILFILFSILLICITLFSKKSFLIAIAGLFVIIVYKFSTDNSFSLFHHLFGSNTFIAQIINKDIRQGEWSIVINLFGLLLGFEILSGLFRESRIPVILLRYLPVGWFGPFTLLLFVFILSAFLDNIAAALIGGSLALVAFNRKVHIAYLVGIVAASNAGGAGSVIGDTTTTMMWLSGISPLNVLHAYIASSVAFIFCGIIASFQQNKYYPVQIFISNRIKLDFGKLLIVIMILVAAIVANLFFDLPVIGVWLALLIGSFFRKIPWKEALNALKGALFLICLVLAATLMPVKSLPEPSVNSTFVLGFISSVFDNIPLTKLCLLQGGYDWGVLAYAVGFGGSMLWFGSSAGVAITNEFPEARNAWLWIKNGWQVIIAYILGFIALYLIMGWNPLK